MSKLMILKSKKKSIALIAIIVLALFATSFWISFGNNATTYSVMINGQVVGYVSNQAEYEEVLKEVKQTLSETNHISIEEVYIDESQIELIPEYREEDAAPVTHINKETLTNSLLEKQAVT
ncbi:MAG: hypothetical protein LBU41_04920, partial [Clostridiales Family XIII bacterium]|nr:hypothetical protein [Clostridiales Family XIII bacterium]